MVSIVRDVDVENLLAGRRYLVSWTLNSISENVTAYEIWRSPTESLGFEKIAEVNSPTYQYIDKVPFTFGINFYYKVIARDASGLRSDINQTSAVSDTTFDAFEETPFRATSISFDTFVAGEVPTGAVNGTNNIFQTLSLYRFKSTAVYVNGLRKKLGTDYTENNDQQTITFTTAPTSGAVILIDYLRV